jgi:hypothetical protein
MGEPEDAELTFPGALALTEEAAAALEDYTRVVARAAAAEVVRSPGAGEESLVRGVRLRGAQVPVTDEVAADVQAFARGLAEGRGGGLGWS